MFPQNTLVAPKLDSVTLTNARASNLRLLGLELSEASDGGLDDDGWARTLSLEVIIEEAKTDDELVCLK